MENRDPLGSYWLGDSAISHGGTSRRDFMQMAAAIGLVWPLASCTADNSPADDGTADGEGFDGRVAVIGAGAAGMSAAYALVNHGIDVTVFEAAPTHGGRIKRLDGFVDFPLPMGGEWLHARAGELDNIVQNPEIEIGTQLVAYDPADPIVTFDGTARPGTIEEDDDLKFVGITWLDFFDEFIVPSIADRMEFDTQIVKVDYTDDTVVLTDQRGDSVEVDAVIVTAPIRVLQRGDISFEPPLPEEKRAALDRADVWGGMKVFLEFSEKFYPVFVEFPDSQTASGQRLYYDAAYGQDSTSNVLGLFAVGEQAKPYQALSGEELRHYLLSELDEIFDGAASRTYMQHVAQNWDNEPFIGQAYLADGASSRTSRALAETIDGRVFFAGDAYTKFDDWSEVHLAARSARDAVSELTSPSSG